MDGCEPTRVDSDQDDAPDPTPSIDDEPPRPGREVDRFVLLDELGRGGMGAVYRAYDPTLDRKVALKIVRDRRRSSPRARRRFLREAQAMARIRHPNVVEVFAVGEHGPRVFIAMELVEGQSLDRWLEARRPWERILPVFIQAAHGLAAAHAVGLIHRDFKPGNVLVGNDGRTRVTDFGLVRLVSETEPPEDIEDEPFPGELATPDDDRLTRVGTQLGTPGYMAPEQAADPRATDPRSDQFGFGVTLYEALYGERPYSPASPFALRRPPRDASVPGWLRRIVIRTIAPAPHERFESMSQVIAHLERRPRRWTGIAMLASGVLVTTAAVVTANDPPSPTTCPDAPALVDAAWGPARQDAVAAAFADHGAFGERTFVRLRTDIDAFTTAWSDALAEACRGRGALGARAFDVKMACLRDRMAGLEAFVDVLATADRPVVEGSALRVRAVIVDPACARVDQAGRVDGPGLGALDPEAEELHGLVADCLALADAEHPDEGLPLATQIIERAHTAGLTRLQAEGYQCRGQLLLDMHEYALAEEAHTAAYWMAREAGAERVAFMAALAISDNIGTSQSEPDQAQAWLRHAAAVLARLPESPLLQARLLDARGIVALEVGRLEEARDAFEQERDLLAITPEATDGDRLLLYNRMAIVATQQGKHDEAIEWGLHHLQQTEAILGADHPELMDILSNIGLFYAYQERFADALAHQNRALALAKAHRRRTDPAFATLWMNRGATLSALGRYDEAKVDLERALAVHRRQVGDHHPDVARVLANLSNLARDSGDPDAAVEYADEAVSILTQALGPEHHETLLTVAMAAAARANRGELAAARTQLEEAHAIYERTVGRHNRNAAAVVRLLAALDEADGDHQLARTRFARSLAVLEETGAAPTAVARLQFDVARNAWEAGDHADACDLAEHAAVAYHNAADPTEPEVRTWLARRRCPRPR